MAKKGGGGGQNVMLLLSSGAFRCGLIPKHKLIENWSNIPPFFKDKDGSLSRIGSLPISGGKVFHQSIL